jgi:hypothetical protein
MRANREVFPGRSTASSGAAPGSPILFDRSRKLKTIIVLATICMVVSVSGVASVLQQRERASPVTPIGRVPTVAIETAFAALGAAADDLAVGAPLEQASCNDFQFAFLHATCSKKHVKYAGQNRRVARASWSRMFEAVSSSRSDRLPSNAAKQTAGEKIDVK